MRNKILIGDAYETLKTFSDQSVNQIVTSPPYFNARVYGMPGELGGERCFVDYLANLTAVIDECQRVLRDDGTLFLNLGDSHGPDKSLRLMPERVAMRMADSGLCLRNVILWYKRNAFPDSCKDRFTVDFEYVYFFTKGPKYWFDQQLEPFATKSLRDYGAFLETNVGSSRGEIEETGYNGQAIKEYEGTGAQNPSDAKRSILKSMAARGGRNKRCVWDVKVKAYKGAHVATFPVALILPMIEAGCPRFVCSQCGTPWKPGHRVIGKMSVPPIGSKKYQDGQVDSGIPATFSGNREISVKERTPDAPACTCNAGSLPGLVLDPFFGSGTVGVAAERLGRDWCGIDLQPEYRNLAEERIRSGK